jgi:hypothetical protein
MDAVEFTEAIQRLKAEHNAEAPKGDDLSMPVGVTLRSLAVMGQTMNASDSSTTHASGAT